MSGYFPPPYRYPYDKPFTAFHRRSSLGCHLYEVIKTWRQQGLAVWDDYPGEPANCPAYWRGHLRVSTHVTVYNAQGTPRQLTGEGYNLLWGDWSI